MMTKKEYAAAAKIAAVHWKRAIDMDEQTSDARAVEIDMANAIIEAFVAFFRRCGGSFDADRFRASCKGERRTVAHG